MSDAAEYWHRQYEALKREHVALIEQAAALRAYAQHDIGCPSDLTGTVVLKSEFRQRPCSCGLDALLAAPEAAP